MGMSARCVCDWPIKIRPKTSQVCGLLLPFIFTTSLYLIYFDRDRPSWLRVTVTLGRSFLKICAATTELAPMNNNEPPTHLGFHLLRCYATKATLSHSSMCNCDRESSSPEPLSSVILHRERTNKVFKK
jgi:hypothetical protein